MIPKRVRDAIKSCEFPAYQVAAAMRQCQPILSYHVAMFTPLQSVDAQMQKLALDCYIQGLLDGASPEVRAALDGIAPGAITDLTEEQYDALVRDAMSWRAHCIAQWETSESAAAGSVVPAAKQGDGAP